MHPSLSQRSGPDRGTRTPRLLCRFTLIRHHVANGDPTAPGSNPAALPCQPLRCPGDGLGSRAGAALLASSWAAAARTLTLQTSRRPESPHRQRCQDSHPALDSTGGAPSRRTCRFWPPQNSDTGPTLYWEDAVTCPMTGCASTPSPCTSTCPHRICMTSVRTYAPEHEHAPRSRNAATASPSSSTCAISCAKTPRSSSPTCSWRPRASWTTRPCNSSRR